MPDPETENQAGTAAATGESWWDRPCGGREVIVLALPLMVSTLSYSLMQFCDRLFLAWSSPRELAAVMPSGMMAWTLLSFPLGVALYTNVFVAQYFGAGENRRIGAVIWHGLILASLSLPLFLFSILFPSLIFDLANHDPAIARDEAIYFRYISAGSIAYIYAAVLTCFYIGQGRTKIIMVVDVAVAILNIALDWLLIFGVAFGGATLLEPMGIRGAAIATSCALWVKAFLFLGLIVGRKNNRHRFGLFERFRFQPDLLRRMFRFGTSNGLQFLIECLGIAIFSLMIARLGETQAAATTVAISVNMMVFVPVWGLSTAVSTMVGQQIGLGRPVLAARATWTSLQVGLAYTGFFALLYLLAPGLFLIGHHAGAENFSEISRLSRWLLVFVAAYCIFDTIQIIFVGAIKGAGDTTYVVFVSLICSGLFVAGGLAGYSYLSSPNARLFWWWGALTGWLVLLSIIFGARFIQGKWKSMQVIEKELIDLPETPGSDPLPPARPAQAGPTASVGEKPASLIVSEE